MWYIGETGEVHTGFWWGDVREIDLLENLRRWENNINMDIQSVRWGSLNWIDLAQDRDRWRLLMHTAVTFRVS
jgi:hypothetical protein